MKSPPGAENTEAATTMSTESMANCDEEKRFWGLKIARELDFTDEQYEEALKRISSPTDANQLLLALIEVSGTKQATAATDEPSQNQHQQPFESLSSASTSCYSSITSFTSLSNASSSNQSLDNLAHQIQTTNQIDHTNNPLASRDVTAIHNKSDVPNDHLRKIYIDGSNVARTHGKDVHFSWMGIKICVDWFHRRQHKVKVFVPMEKCCQQISVPVDATLSIDRNVIEYLTQLDILVKTPTGCNDDLFIIEAAKHNNGIIVSNDLYRDEKRRMNDAELEQFIYLNRLPYIFVDDLFIPAPDPRGRAGPTLAEFLLAPSSGCDHSCLAPSASNNHRKLFRTKSHQRSSVHRNQTNLSGQHYHNHQQQSEYSQHLYHRSLQATRSLPAEQVSRPSLQAQFRGSAPVQANYVPNCPSGQLISIGRANQSHNNNSNNNSNNNNNNYNNHYHLQHRELQSNRGTIQNREDPNGTQKLRKSVSIAYENTITTGAEEATPEVATGELIRRRHAVPLCRTKSHV